MGDGIRCVEPLIAEISIQITVNGIGTAPGNHVHIAAQRAAEFRLTAFSDHLKLADDIEAVE